MVMDGDVLPPILHPSRTAYSPGKSPKFSARIIEVILRHFHNIIITSDSVSHGNTPNSENRLEHL